MPIAMTVIAVNTAGNQTRVMASLAFTGSYPTGGDTLDLTTLIGQSHGDYVVAFNSLPVTADPTIAGGLDMEVIPGATLSTFKGKLFTSGGTELGAGTYVAGAALLAASLNSTIEWIFDKLL
jgi:hypothetical protein